LADIVKSDSLTCENHSIWEVRRNYTNATSWEKVFKHK